MKPYTVVFTPEAEDQLATLLRDIALASSAEVALRYTNAIVDYCEGLATFPRRGVSRDDIRRGLRVTHYERRTVIAYAVDEQTVSIIGVFYGGQDYETALRESGEE